MWRRTNNEWGRQLDMVDQEPVSLPRIYSSSNITSCFIMNNTSWLLNWSLPRLSYNYVHKMGDKEVWRINWLRTPLAYIPRCSLYGTACRREFFFNLQFLFGSTLFLIQRELTSSLEPLLFSVSWLTWLVANGVLMDMHVILALLRTIYSQHKSGTQRKPCLFLSTSSMLMFMILALCQKSHIKKLCA